jgi:tetratricopeptide (TPR) repeat protein
LPFELAAARVASLQPAEIAGLLDERFRLLAGSRRRTVERHQTLRATVDWSYSLLREIERTVFDRLGTFVGSFDTTAAHAVVAGADIGRFDVVDALGELVAKSMVTAEPAPDGTTRYQLLETLRQYALERLEQAGEVELYRRRHAEHYATVTAELGRTVYGPDEASVRARLDRETDNLRAAIDWSIDAGEPELVRALIDPIAREAGWNRGSEVGGWAERALSLMGDDPAPWRRVRYAVALKAFFADADWVETLRILDSLLDESDLPAALRADAFTVRANSLALLGDIDGCIAAYEDAFAWMSANPAIDPHDHAAISVVGNFAIFLALAGDVIRARAVAEDCLRHAEASGAPSTLALAHFAVGGAYVDDDPARAIASYEEALRFSVFGVSNVVRDHSLQMLALIAWREGDMAAAARHLERALKESFAMGDYSSCGVAFELAIPVFAEREHWHAVLAMDTALTDGTIPLTGFKAYGEAEARGRAVAAARSALGDVAAKAGNASRVRDTLVREVIAELEMLAAG